MGRIRRLILGLGIAIGSGTTATIINHLLDLTGIEAVVSTSMVIFVGGMIASSGGKKKIEVTHKGGTS